MCITKPEHAHSSTAVLYLTDVFGIQLAENKPFADSFIHAGHPTVAPDLFGGSPAPGDINVPGSNTTTFLARHGPKATDPIIATTIAYMRNTLGDKRIGTTGYCFRGRYALRFTAAGKGAGAAFAAHPRLQEDGEISDTKGRLALLLQVSCLPTAGRGNRLDDAARRRSQIQALQQKMGLAHPLAPYSGTRNGSGVRANAPDLKQKFGKEPAFPQAVRWLDAPV